VSTATIQRASRTPPRQHIRSRAGQEHPWTFAVPALVVLGLFLVLPTLLNFVLPYTDWSAFKSNLRFVGLANFGSITSDGSLQQALRITLTYAVLVAVFQNGLGLGLALLLERDTWLNRLARSVFFLPVLISALAGGYIAQAMLKPDGGLNQILSALSGQPVEIAWLGSSTWTVVVVALVHGWKWMGLAMLIYLAGLKSVPHELIEAGRIDGASGIQIFRRIKFPLLAPAITFNVATALIGTLNGFDIVQATTGGGPARSTEILNIFIFRTFGSGLYAQASAMSLVLFLAVVIIAVPLIIYLRSREKVLA